MDEEFLQFAWKFRLLENNLTTVEGERLEVIKPGQHNTNSGPDFFNARINLGGTTWAGNVECHVKSSDWYRHGHQNDRSYDNIILHVVYDHDDRVLRADGTSLPTLETSGFLKLKALEIYRHWLRNREAIPCSQMIGSVEKIYFSDWLTSLSVFRLERKTALIRKSWEVSGSDFNHLFYLHLFKSFGQRINAVTFELLMRTIPLHVIQECRGDRLMLEALLFGQAGMLEEISGESYPVMLKKLYREIKTKHQLVPLSLHLWKFLRLRPAAFPTIRISQLAGLINKYEFLPDVLLGKNDPEELMKILETDASNYWETHYIFNRNTNHHGVSLGTDARRLIIINLVNPFKLMRPGLKIREVTREAIDLLERMEPEQNSITRNFKNLGFDAMNASESQAMVELKSQYCSYKRCLSCRIGFKLIKRFA